MAAAWAWSSSVAGAVSARRPAHGQVGAVYNQHHILLFIQHTENAVSMYPEATVQHLSPTPSQLLHVEASILLRHPAVLMSLVC